MCKELKSIELAGWLAYPTPSRMLRALARRAAPFRRAWGGGEADVMNGMRTLIACSAIRTSRACGAADDEAVARRK